MKKKDLLVLSFGFIAFFVLGPIAQVLLSLIGPEDFLPQGKLTLVISAIACAFGIFFTSWAVWEMFKVGKGGPAVLGPVKLMKETQVLVTTGPYAMCRNPMHLGIILYLLGFACYLNSLWALIVPVLMWIFAFILAVFVDEKRLERDFKDEFLDYKSRVPRFLPEVRKRF